MRLCKSVQGLFILVHEEHKITCFTLFSKSRHIIRSRPVTDATRLGVYTVDDMNQVGLISTPRTVPIYTVNAKSPIHMLVSLYLIFCCQSNVAIDNIIFYTENFNISINSSARGGWLYFKSQYLDNMCYVLLVFRLDLTQLIFHD